jgi:hypothetical protein
MANTAIYRDLDKERHQIRLFTVHSGQLTDRIVGTLTTASLDDDIDYEALSYTWGNVNETKSVYVKSIESDDLQQIEVTVNLEAALYDIRQSDKNKTIWIDAICINQTDGIEKNHQIQLMGRVYKQARNVIAWLGSGNAQSDVAIDAIELLGQDCSIHWDSYKKKHSIANVDARFDENLEYRDQIYQILTSSWWTRIWTCQETILAKAITFVCGRRAIPEELLLALKRSYDQHISQDCCRLLIWTTWDEFSRMFTKAGPVMQLRDNWRSSGMRNILHIMSSQRFRECHNPRDRVYGFLGLTDGSLDELMNADYNMGIAEVYTKFAFGWIQKTNSLSLFSYLLSSTNTEYPSWALGWDFHASAPSILAATERARYQVAFSATKGRDAEVKRLSQSDISVRGFFCDEIIEVGNIHSDPIGIDWYKVDEWWSILNLRRNPKSSYIAGGDTRSAFLHVLLGYAMQWSLLHDVIKKHKVSPGDDPRDFTVRGAEIPNWVQSFVLSRIKSKGPVLALTNRTSMWASATTHPRRLKERSSELLGAINLAISNRRLVVTKKGYIGLAMPEAAPGDTINLLLGARMPIILRPLPKSEVEGVCGSVHRHIVLGDAFVHGLMYGEGIETLEQDDEPQDFTLV